MVAAVLLAVVLSGTAPAPAGAEAPIPAEPALGEPESQPRRAAPCPGLLLVAPVRARIADPFRLPDGPYRAGNRGIEYVTVAGQAVVAAGAGRVVFAGRVAGSLHITVDHGGGILTSYSFLGAIEIAVGDDVVAGQRIARAGPILHFGLRLDGRYLDPVPYLGRVRAFLVPRATSARRISTYSPCPSIS